MSGEKISNDHVFERAKVQKNGLLKTSNNFTSSGFLQKELEWLQSCIKARSAENTETAFPQAPTLNGQSDAYASFLTSKALTLEDRLLLITSIAPIVSPSSFQPLIDPQQKILTKDATMGGFVDKVFLNFLPTLRTFMYLLWGQAFEKQTAAFMQVHQNSQLLQDQIVTLEAVPHSLDKHNPINQVIRLAPEYLRFLLGGEKPRPDFGHDFPATLVETAFEWEDLILPEDTTRKIQRIQRWMEFSPQLLAQSKGKINPSFPCLFYGPPGTGKTLTSMLLGKSFGKDVFRIDLSMVVSKYIGETEKNLARLFDRAEGKGWILFFDEADALFGKRTQVNDAHDKWANLEVSYLLQRLENYPGLTILASNLKDNLDSALTRRFQAMIEFPRPGPAQLQKLWQRLIPEPFSYSTSINFEPFNTYRLTGANVSNILKYACLDAVSVGETVLSTHQLQTAIRAELHKENRTI